MYNVFLTKMSAFLPASKTGAALPGCCREYGAACPGCTESKTRQPSTSWRITAVVTRILCWRLNTRFRVAALAHRFRQQSIHLREKNIAGPTERSSKGGTPPLLIARREGPAFFDEDDVCCRYMEPGSSLSDPGNWHTLR